MNGTQKEHKQNPKNQTRTDQYPWRNYPELLNTPIIMLRNTAAGKAAVGPSNTSDSEIITILTPQAELTEANAKIKWL